MRDNYVRERERERESMSSGGGSGGGGAYTHYPTAPLYPQPPAATSVAAGYPYGAATGMPVGDEYGGGGYAAHYEQQQQQSLYPQPYAHQQQQQYYVPPTIDTSPYGQQQQQQHAQYRHHHQQQSHSSSGRSSHQHQHHYEQQQQHHAPQPKRVPAGDHDEDDDGAALFKLSIEREGGDFEGAVIKLALDGVRVFDASGARLKKIYSLDVITSWKLRDYPGASDRLQLTIWTKSSVDDNEKALTLLASGKILRLVVDTLACTIMQMCEMLGIEPGDLSVRVNGGEVKNTLAGRAELIKKITEETTADDADSIEFWTQAEKSGWMMSQGEHIKTWRKRFFILKQRHLFRFLAADVNSSTKTRGVIDLSKLTDIKESEEGHTFIERSVLGGKKCYVLTLTRPKYPSFKLAFEDVAERDDWGIAIRSAADSVAARRKSHADFVQQIENNVESASGSQTQQQGGGGGGMVNLNLYEHGSGGGRDAHARTRRPSNPSPAPPPAPQIARPIPNDIYKWQAHYTPDGRVYYHNTETGETTWDL